MLTACAGTYHTYVNNIKLALKTTPDVELSVEQVRQAKSDLLYVRHGERARAALALLRVEAGQHKWLSADGALLVMEQGRVVRTLGFANDLLHLTNTAGDPLRSLTSIGLQTSWLRLADWHAGEYGYRLNSTFTVTAGQTLTFFGQQLETLLVTEQVQYLDRANFFRTENSWQNRFWFDAQSGTLIQSEQQLAPFWQPMQMIYISRIARLLPPAATTIAEGRP
uniref:YjbF outer membrane lipoprotein n=1 Tax=Rheinheimera sp. BAL341 TaxID=1708203 RepID=A0A486XVA1_9GAMM